MFKSALAYVEGKGIIKTDITFDEKITSIGDNLDGEIIPLEEDAIILPGFIDCHIHGAGGCDTMDGNKESLHTFASTLVKEGTTSFLATTMTQSKDIIINALENVKNFMKAQSEGARLLGVHLEGPFIAEKFAGAQPSEYILQPSIEDFDLFNLASGNNIKIVTIAPEKQGAKELIQHLTKLNIVSSIGHSEAGYNDILNAVNKGASSVTHTFNAQSPLHHREIGVAGSALMMDELNTEVICDGIHISLPAISLLLKSKPQDKVTLITDAMRAKGLPDGESELGGQKVIVKDGSARLTNGVLAGSILKMNHAIKLLVTKLNIPLTQAVDYATINPARLLKLENTIGSISLNKQADFTVLNKDFDVVLTIVNGKIVYKK